MKIPKYKFLIKILSIVKTLIGIMLLYIHI